MAAVVVARLAANTLLTAAAIVFTLGCSRGMRIKFGRYLQLICWHVRGCPQDRFPENRHVG
jgi:hypothetical protein